VNLIYFWQGRDSTRNEKGTSAYLTIDLTEEIGGEATQVRVVHNKEEPHFLSLFKQRYSIWLGKTKEYNVQETYLFEIRGNDSSSTRAHQVEAATISLNFLHTFVLLTASRIFIWQGRNSNDSEKETARLFAERLKQDREIVNLTEGNESSEFWTHLKGGKGSYYGTGEYRIETTMSLKMPATHPRLFLCSNATGSVKIDEIANFAQDEQDNPQNENHLLILDAFYEIYVWIGKYSMSIERKLGMQAALEYVEKSAFGHSKNTPFWVTHPFQEPLGFTAHFRGWSTLKFPPKLPGPVAKIPLQDVLKDYTKDTFTYAELQQDPLPPGVNPKKLEMYLSDQDFETVFKMPRSQFIKLPAWKADRLKQQANLY
jgi:hypothetical protein